jgi:carbamoyltransferase
MDMSYFAFCHRKVMTSPAMDKLFGGPPRRAESPITQREMDLAASIQAVTEEIMLRSAAHAHDLTGLKNLVMAGGVALNCVGNGRLLREGPFERIWIQPAAGDAGGALGAALFVWYQLLENPRTAHPGDAQKGSLLGPSFPVPEIEAFLRSAGAVYRRIDREDELVAAVSGMIAAGQVVGHLAGRMEFGPRALKSFDPQDDGQPDASTMNLKIKFRESFGRSRPRCCGKARPPTSTGPGESPYMLLVASVRPERRKNSLTPPPGS